VKPNPAGSIAPDRVFAMSSGEVDEYLQGFSGPSLDAAIQLRKALLKALPQGEEGISYKMPVIKVQGKAIAGYAIAKNHIGYYPHSSLVLDQIPELLGEYQFSKGALKIPFDKPLKASLVEKLVVVRLAMLDIPRE
jgi:uncharacterized protein YdhG (YjbR/CyaY superfamily)